MKIIKSSKTQKIAMLYLLFGILTTILPFYFCYIWLEPNDFLGFLIYILLSIFFGFLSFFIGIILFFIFFSIEKDEKSELPKKQKIPK